MEHTFRAEEHNEPKDSQLIVALTGSPEFIKTQLEEMVKQFDQYKKPMQGIVSSYGGTKEVITKVWKGQDY